MLPTAGLALRPLSAVHVIFPIRAFGAVMHATGNFHRALRRFTMGTCHGARFCQAIPTDGVRSNAMAGTWFLFRLVQIAGRDGGRGWSSTPRKPARVSDLQNPRAEILQMGARRLLA